MIGDSAIGVVSIGELAPTGTPGSYTLTVAAGSFSLTGIATGLRIARRVAPTVGSYSLTGIAAGLRSTRRVAPAVGSYALTGNNATLIKSGNYVLTAQAGSYSLTGIATGLRATRRVTPAVGSYALTGITSGLRSGRRISPAVGSYSLTGIAAGLRSGRRVAPAVGSYSLTGVSSGLRSTRRLQPSVGSYGLTGNNATLTYGTTNRVLIVASGVYLLTPTTTRLLGPARGTQLRTDVVIEPYQRRGFDKANDNEALIAFLIEELRRVENTLRNVTDGSPQVADREPTNKRRGMIRYAVNPWNPGSGDGLYVYTGTAWSLIS